jgi:hypothetical protein
MDFEHASWNQFGFDAYDFPPGDLATSKIESVKGQKSIARRAKYKFAVIGLAAGNAAWDVEYLNESEEIVSTVAKSVAITDGEIPLQNLDPNEVAGASAARIVNIVVVDDDENPIQLGPGIEGSWMLQIIIRTGRWGFAELATPSDPPFFYLKKKTIHERIEDGGGGPCTDCPDMAYYVTAIRDREEELTGGEFITTTLQDEISDGTNTTRWGLGGILSTSGFTFAVGAGTSTGKTKTVDESLFTKADARICGALSLDIPDAEGEVLNVTEKDAETESSNTPRACEEPQLTVADEAARLALSSCSSGPAIGSMFKQTDDDTLWEIISHPDPCGPLTAEHWVERYGKRIPRQFLTTMHPDSAVWITGVEAIACTGGEPE